MNINASTFRNETQRNCISLNSPNATVAAPEHEKKNCRYLFIANPAELYQILVLF